MIARLLVVLILAAELGALVVPARARPLFVAVPAGPVGQAVPDSSTLALAGSEAGARFLHEMTADDVARGVWGLDQAGTPVAVDPADLAAAAALHRKVGALREQRRAAVERLGVDGVALAAWAYR